MPTIKWLHLSDFHVGLDKYGQTQLFKYILNHIKERKDKQGNIDFVFITGDIAQSGLKQEYDIFAEEFILPLEEIVGKECSLLTVAGNHDADREKQKFFSRDEILETIQFFDPTIKGLENRQYILERFSAYSNLYQPYLNENWINSENGYFVHKVNLKGINIGILGLNTAWLSKDGKDEGKLTAGKAIVEKGLEEIQKCDVKLALGHHPITWLYDKEPIRALFAKNQVIYLHGHLHKGGSRYEENAGHQFLALQSGAAFQEREGDKYVNGLLWGQLDFKSGIIELEPYKWKRKDQNWSLDSDAFPETFRDGGVWKLPLPQKLQSPSAASSKNNKKPPKPFSVPLGWEILDLGELNKRRNEPDTATILKYFDGRIPNWALALSAQIPRRRIVTELTQEINEFALNKQSSITILVGAGGEGKSTAFLQTIASILETQSNWKVLYHKDENSRLSQGVMAELSKEYRWLIASDDADLIAEDIYHAAQNQRDHIHFLLAARDTDWYDQKLEKLKWSTVFSKAYSEKKLNGLIEEDAKQVVQAWANYHDEGLGKLAGLSIEEATQRFLTESVSEAKQESAFFGALLRVRYGDDLKGHIKKLLDRLKERPIMEGNKYTLLDAFAYIAAMHAENQLFLSKLVLAQVLNLEVGKLRSKVLHPLGEEAAASMAGEYVFTRHHAIAETTMRLLEEELIYGIEPDEVYIELVTTAESLCQKGYFVPPNIGKWRYLSDHFFAKNNYSLAIRLTQNLLKICPTDAHMRVKLAQQFRKAGQPAIKVFREAPITDNSRVFFAEWGTSEGNEYNYALNLYLTCYALADETLKSPPDNETAKICLSSLALASQELFKKYNKLIFIEACSAAVHLGLSVKYLDDRAKNNLLKCKSFLEEKNITNVVTHTATLNLIQEALIVAYNQREADLPTWLHKPDDLHFEGLKDLLNIR
jgi:hypothetical protein